MAKKTARQLDREINETLNGRQHLGQNVRPWWIWQLGSRSPRVLKKVELPWAYSWKGITEGEMYSREPVSNLGFKDVSKLRVLRRRFGSMLAVEISKQGVHQLITPPIYLFADLQKIDPKINLADIGSSRFWIQPEILQATRSEVYQGDSVNDLIDVDRDALNEASAENQHAVNDVLVALDAYLERDSPDPRFV
jgi:hypothetical protein